MFSMGSLEDTKLKEERTPVWLLGSPHLCLSNQLQEHSVKAPVEGCRPRLETERGNHGELQQWKWLKQTGWMWPSTSPSVHTLPMWNHLMHVPLLSLVNQNAGGGGLQLPHKSPTTRSRRTLGRAIIKTWGREKKKGLDLWGVLAECENVLKALCASPDAGRWVSEVGCLWGGRKDWAGDVSVGGTEGKKGEGMWEMS